MNEQARFTSANPHGLYIFCGTPKRNERKKTPVMLHSMPPFLPTVQRVPNWKLEYYTFYRTGVPSARPVLASRQHRSAQCRLAAWHWALASAQCLAATISGRQKLKNLRVKIVKSASEDWDHAPTILLLLSSGSQPRLESFLSGSGTKNGHVVGFRSALQCPFPASATVPSSASPTAGTPVPSAGPVGQPGVPLTSASCTLCTVDMGNMCREPKNGSWAGFALMTTSNECRPC